MVVVVDVTSIRFDAELSAGDGGAAAPPFVPITTAVAVGGDSARSRWAKLSFDEAPPRDAPLPVARLAPAAEEATLMV